MQQGIVSCNLRVLGVVFWLVSWFCFVYMLCVVFFCFLFLGSWFSSWKLLLITGRKRYYFRVLCWFAFLLFVSLLEMNLCFFMFYNMFFENLCRYQTALKMSLFVLIQSFCIFQLHLSKTSLFKNPSCFDWLSFEFVILFWLHHVCSCSNIPLLDQLEMCNITVFIINLCSPELSKVSVFGGCPFRPCLMWLSPKTLYDQVLSVFKGAKDSNICQS